MLNCKPHRILLIAAALTSPARGDCQSDVFSLPSKVTAESISSGRTSVEIRRSFQDPQELEALEKAESLPPEPEVLFAFRKKTCANVDGHCVPAAATGHAVNHYLGLLQAWRLMGIDACAKLEYLAWIEHPPSRPPRLARAEVAVARTVVLRLSWEASVGGFREPSVTMERRVEFDADGQVLSVHGDGEPSVIVE